MAFNGMRVTGVTETRAALARAALQIKAAGEAATDDGADELADDMRGRVAVDTGATRDEIGVTDGDQAGTKNVGLAQTDSGHFLEWGTSDTPAQPFAMPAAEAARPRFPAKVAAAVKGAVG